MRESDATVTYQLYQCRVGLANELRRAARLRRPTGADQGCPPLCHQLHPYPHEGTVPSFVPYGQSLLSSAGTEEMPTWQFGAPSLPADGRQYENAGSKQ